MTQESENKSQTYIYRGIFCSNCNKLKTENHEKKAGRINTFLLLMEEQGARIIVVFQSEIMQIRRVWSEIFQVERKGKSTNLEFYILQKYPRKVKEK